MEEYMKAYVAKDKNGKIFIYTYKPAKRDSIWAACAECVCEYGYYDFPIEGKDLPEGVNPQWEDEEAIEVELKIEKI